MPRSCSSPARYAFSAECERTSRARRWLTRAHPSECRQNVARSRALGKGSKACGRACREDDVAYPPQPQPHHRLMHRFHQAASSEHRRIGHAHALRGHRFVARHQAHHLFEIDLRGGPVQAGHQLRQDHRQRGQLVESPHAFLDALQRRGARRDGGPFLRPWRCWRAGRVRGKGKRRGQISAHGSAALALSGI